MALTQIHGNRQILDGTIKDADIAGDATIANSKLNLASITQAVTLTHPNGLRVEAFDTQILLSDTAVTLPDGLWRIKDTSGNLDFAVNRAVAGDFSANKIVLRLVNFAGGAGDRIDVFSLLQTTNDIRLQSAEPTVILRETDQVLPAGLYRMRLAGDSLRFERNTALAGDFSLPDLDIEVQPNNISVNKPLSLFADLAISKADAQLRMRETDQTLPAGLWRLRLDADQLTVEKNTAASGDFSTADVPLRFFGTNVIVVRTERFQMSNTAIQFTEYTGPAHGSILYRDGVGFLKFNNSSGQSRRVLFHESVVVRETPVGAVDGVNTAFTLSAVPLDNSEQVYLNGILQSPGAAEDYTMASGTITFNNPPQPGDKIRVTYIKSTL